MGITLFKDSADSDRQYLRITRAIDGKEQQRYVRVTGNSKTAMNRALAEARKIDARLLQWQKAVRQLKAISGDSLIHDDGSIVGLQLQTRKRKGRKPATEFKIRVKLDGRAPVFKSVSVDTYGFEEAFQRAAERICELRDLGPDAEARARLLECADFYRGKWMAMSRSDSESDAEEELCAVPPVDLSSRRQSAALTTLATELANRNRDHTWISQTLTRLLRR